jgi:hypothetical protein
VLIAAGVSAVNADLFLHLPRDQGGTSLRTMLGVAAAFMALAAWTAYAVDNAAYLRAHPATDVSDWATLQGIATLGWVIAALRLWALAAAIVDGLPAPHLVSALGNHAFLAWILFLASAHLGSALRCGITARECCPRRCPGR